MTREHTKDEECTIDPETGCCRECGAGHDAPCEDCGGAAFHRDDCPEAVALPFVCGRDGFRAPCVGVLKNHIAAVHGVRS